MISDYINTQDPKCLYCANTIMRKPKHSLNMVSIYECVPCSEKIYVNHFGNNFAFTCLDIVCEVNLIKNTISISYLEKIDSADKVNRFFKNTIALFKLDFSDKNKLNKKLKIYLSFS